MTDTMEEGNGTYLHNASKSGSDQMEALDTLRSANSVVMSPELFEKLYLSPQNQVKGGLRQTFANPTPIGLVGFLMSLTPLSCSLMGWRGASGNGAATIGVYFFMGGLLMIIGGVLEWILGNSFASIVFCTFGGFWLAYGGTLVPSFAAFSSYAPPDAASPAEGLKEQGFNASIGFWMLFFGLVCFIFLVCSLRTNILFVLLFFSLVIAMFLLTGAYWSQAADYAGNANVTNKLLVGAGACGFATSLAGWYLFASILLEIVDFPLQLPVGDLSGVIKGKTEKARRG